MHHKPSHMSVLSCRHIRVYGWCIQTSALIPSELKQSRPDMPRDVYFTGRCNAHKDHME